MFATVGEAIFDISARNGFIFYTLDKVREDLTCTIADIVKPRFGDFVGSLLASQLALLSATTVTFMVAELWTWALKELILSVYELSRRIFGCKPSKPMPSAAWQIAMRVTSFCLGFYVKHLFSTRCMSHVGSCLRVITASQGSFLLPLMIPIITPSITFFVADIVGLVASRISYKVLNGRPDVSTK